MSRSSIVITCIVGAVLAAPPSAGQASPGEIASPQPSAEQSVPKTAPPAAETPPPAAQAPAARGTRLQGRVAAGRRQPVIGATVIARRQGDDSAVYLTTSGPDGVFVIDGLPDGRYSLLLRREGMLPVLKEDVELKFPFRAVIEVPMQPGVAALPAVQTASSGSVRLRGRVLGSQGVPLADVRIRMVRPGGSEDPLTARTGVDGGFDFGDVAAGSWQTEVSGVGYLTVRAGFPVVRDVDARIYLVEQPAGYDPSPLDLMPPERAIPPDGWNEGPAVE